jgi:UDP-glucose 4-epimerase
MMEQMSKSMGVDLNLKYSPRRSGDSPQLIASTAKIESDLGWKPKATLEEMIESSWAADKANS